MMIAKILILLRISSLVLCQQYYLRQALIPFSSGNFETKIFTCAPVSIYTVHYDVTNNRPTFDPNSYNRSQYGSLSKSLEVYHPFGYRISGGSEMILEYPARHNIYGRYAARISIPSVQNEQLRLVVDNEGTQEDGMVVIVQNDDYGNNMLSAYPLLLGTDPQEFKEVYAVLDYGGDEDWFMVGILDPENTLKGRPTKVNFWTETPWLSSGRTTDTFGFLYDKDGKMLANHDDIVTGVLQNFDFEYDLIPNEPYFIRIRAWSLNGVGPYIFRYSQVQRTNTNSLLITVPSETLTRTDVGFNTLTSLIPYEREYFNESGPVTSTLTENALFRSTSTLQPQIYEAPGDVNAWASSKGLTSPFVTTYNQVTFSCFGSCPVRQGTAVTEQFCVPHANCTISNRPQVTRTCNDTCSSMNATVVTGCATTTFGITRSPLPPPSSRTSIRRSRKRLTTDNPDPKYQTSLLQVTRDSQRLSGGMFGITSPLGISFYAFSGVTIVIIIMTLIASFLYCRKSDNYEEIKQSDNHRAPRITGRTYRQYVSIQNESSGLRVGTTESDNAQ
jgi:hypothetical protein